MSVLQLNNVYKQFVGEYILKDINFTIEDKDKIGLIGLNGAGKSTLIKIILGEERIDPNEKNEIGMVSKSLSMKIGYLSQKHEFIDQNNTIYEEMMEIFHEERTLWKEIQHINILLGTAKESELDALIEKLSTLTTLYEAKNGYEIEYKIRQILTGLELTGEDYDEALLKDLSGGEKTRVSLAKLLLQEPDLLILDEPTNHLDLVSIEWLESYLKRYYKAFLIVSHDRMFLDNVCNKIYEIENKKLYKYDGDFSTFIIQKELILKGELKRFEKEQDKIKKMEEYIDRFRAGIKSKQARGRQKILNRMERMDDPIFNPQRMKLKFETAHPSGEIVLKVSGIEKSFNGKKILNDINFELHKGERVGIIGKNGIGKSTLLKIIVDKLKKDKGEVTFGSRVKVGYYDQDHQELLNENTILQEINTSLQLTEEYLRTLAGGFLFAGEDVLKKVEKLSGGEKVRVSFLKLILEKANLLLLDEPTNHLDIYSIEVLEEALEEYDGTMLIVSHNRHFLDSVCNMIYYLDEHGLSSFKGNYDDYRLNLKQQANKNINENNEENKKQSGKLSYQEQKDLNSKINKLKRVIEQLEKEMENISMEKEQLEKEMDKAGRENNVGLLIELQTKLDTLMSTENEKIELWSNYSEELEEKCGNE